MRSSRSCVLSHDSTDCGPAALATVARHYGLDLPLATFRRLVGVDLQGSDMRDLARVAQSLGFEASCGRAKPGVLDRIPLPAVARFSDTSTGHFVTLHRVRRDEVLIADPFQGIVALPRQEFMRKWSRDLVLLSPGRDFHPRKERRSAIYSLLAVANAYRSHVVVAGVLATSGTMFTFLLSYQVARFIDLVAPKHDAGLALAIALSACALAAARALAHLLRQLLLSTLGCKIEAELGIRYVTRVLSLPLMEFDKRTAGDLLGYASDVSKLRGTVVDTLMTIVLDVCLVVAGVVSLLWYNPTLTMIELCFIPPALLAGVAAAPRLRLRQWIARRMLTRTTTRLLDAIVNIRVIRAYSGEDHAQDRVAEAYRAALDAHRRSIAAGAWLSTGAMCLSGAAGIAVLYLGVLLVMSQRLTLGQLVFSYSIIGVLFATIEHLAPSLVSFQDALVSAERLTDLHLADERRLPATACPRAVVRGDIELVGVQFCHRRGQAILKGIDLKVAAGQTVAVLGRTGAGKTTLAYIVAGLYSPTVGTVLADGRPISESDQRLLRDSVALVFQDGGIIDGTIHENIALGAAGVSRDSVVEAARLAAVDDFISGLPKGYDHQVGTQGLCLSSGQRQRIAIARALIRKSPILIMDEATGNLDSVTEQRILDNIHRVRHGRATTMLVTHRLQVASRADFIVVIDDGRVVEAGTHEDMIEHDGPYCRLWQASRPTILSRAVVNCG